jgi:hypothetical protein
LQSLCIRKRVHHMGKMLNAAVVDTVNVETPHDL